MVRQRTSAAVFLALLLALNAWILARLFKTEYTPWMSSIGGSYIGLSRWMRTHWTELGWFPLWYAGIPFENAYPPLLHALVAAAASAAGISAAHSHHVVTGAMYCLGPLALFWLVWRLSGSQWKAFVAGRVFSLLSTSEFFQPMVGNREGPHVTSITLTLVALVVLHSALDKSVG